jgi:hypothetical protein
MICVLTAVGAGRLSRQGQSQGAERMPWEEAQLVNPNHNQASLRNFICMKVADRVATHQR